MIDQIVRAVVKSHPDILPYLSGKAVVLAFEARPYKTYEELLEFVKSTVRDLYIGKLGTFEFIDDMVRGMTGQIKDAYEYAWNDAEMEGAFPRWLDKSMIDFSSRAVDMNLIYSFYKDIIKARETKAPLLPLLERAQLWANRWNDAYNAAMLAINSEMGQKLKWVEGDTEKKCDVCVALNGIVAYAKIWDELGVKPQSAPNSKLTCGGWRCQCYFEVTTSRATRNARDRIRAAVGM